MIKLYTSTFVTLLCASSTLLAQIVIDQDDMPSAGDTMQYSIGFDIGIDVDDTGPNYNWDYSSIFPIDQGADTFVTVGSTPFLYQFFFNNGFLFPDHNATMAVKGEDLELAGTTFTDLYDYYKNDGGAYKNVGFGATVNGLPLSIRNQPVDYVYNFPLNYGDVDSSYSSFAVTVPTLGFYGQNKWRHNEVDGWGTLTIPYGTFDVLRVKSTINATDTVYIDALQVGFSLPRPETVEYKWLALDEGIPVLQVNTLFGFPVLIKYKDGEDLTTGIEQQKGNELLIYPNPAQDVLNISFGADRNGATIEMYDINGRIVASTKLTGVQGIVDVSALSTGQYVLRAIGADTVIYHNIIITR